MWDSGWPIQALTLKCNPFVYDKRPTDPNRISVAVSTVCQIQKISQTEI